MTFPQVTRPGDVTDPHRVGHTQVNLVNPYVRADERYRAARPPYPASAVAAVLAAREAAGDGRIADVGAGTGLMTLPLVAAGAEVVAIEPAEAMSTHLRTQAPDLPVLAATAEATTLADASCAVVCYAQSWHWVDPAAASAEAARILTPSGRICVVATQLDVRVGWVKRLTRIMRSGDVYRPDRPPRFGPAFDRPRLQVIAWSQRLTPAEIALVGQTRSSYLRASEAGRAHMRRNLEWYLHDFLAVPPDAHLELPQTTLVWTAARA